MANTNLVSRRGRGQVVLRQELMNVQDSVVINIALKENLPASSNFISYLKKVHVVRSVGNLSSRSIPLCFLFLVS